MTSRYRNCGYRWSDDRWCMVPQPHRCTLTGWHLLRPHACACGATIRDRATR